MMPSLDDMLDAFQRQVKVLVDEVQPVRNGVFRKVLYVSMLDALSACAYPHEKKSWRRFQTFVLNIGKWTDGERISLPQAALFFQGDPRMSNAIATLLNQWSWGQPQSITSDPDPTQLPTHPGLLRVQHLNLLWQFRNSVLHAFEDRSGFEFGDRAEPYYTGDASTHTWRLIIPEQFLRSLISDSLSGLITFCRQNGQDPQAHLGKELWV